MVNPRFPWLGPSVRPSPSGRGDAEALRRAAADGDPLAAAAGGDQRRRSSDAEAGESWEEWDSDGMVPPR